MRQLIFPVFAAVLSLAGCNSAPAPSAPTAQAPAATSVSGTVTYRQRMNLSPQARLDLQLVDVSQASYIVAQKTMTSIGQVPITFDLAFDPGKIVDKDIYVVRATIIDGERRFVPTLQYPVLTKGAPARVEIIANPETTASEKLKAEFGKLENLIGGMKRVTGDRETEELAVGWDAFFDGSDLRFVRENTDHGDKGRTNIKFAYLKTGQPMMAVKEELAAGSTHPLSVTRVGWSESGELVLKERIGGDAAEPSAEEAKTLYDGAKNAAVTANAKKRR